jgi:hypothetical protein
VFKNSKIAAMIFVGILLCVLSLQVCFAQGWEACAVLNGNEGLTQTQWFSPYTGTNTYRISGYDSVQGAGGQPFCDGGGTVATTFYYMGTNASLLPASINVLESSAAYSTAGWNWCGLPLPIPFWSQSISDAFGDPVKTFLWAQWDGAGQESFCSGSHLNKYAVTIVSPPQSINGQLYCGKVTLPVRVFEGNIAFYGTPSTDDAAVSAGSNEYISLNSRAVSIYQPVTNQKVNVGDVADDEKKGSIPWGIASGPALDPDGDPNWLRLPHVPLPNGELDGDIGIQDMHESMVWQAPPGTGVTYPVHNDPIPYTLTVMYEAKLSSGWTTSGLTYKWTDALKNIAASGIYGIWDAIPGWDNNVGGITPLMVTYNGAIIPVDGTDTLDLGDTDNTDNIHIDVTDGTGSDGAKATSNYSMRIHRSIELLPSNTPVHDVAKQLAVKVVSNPPYAVKGLGVAIQYEVDPAGWSIAKGVVNLLQVIPNSWVQLALAAVGITIDNIQPKEVPVTVSYNNLWDQGDGTFHDLNGTSNKPALAEDNYRMTPIVMEWYKPTWSRIDSYGGTGFLSEQKGCVYTPDGLDEARGNFTVRPNI